MIWLNLLPPREKTELKLLRLYLVVKELIFLLLVGLIAMAIILLLAKHNLQLQLAEVIADTTLTSGVQLSNNEIRTFKAQLVRLQQIQDSYRPWTRMVPKLLDLLPPGVTLDELTVDRSGGLVLGAVAATRDDLLRLRDRLNASGLIEPFDIPLDELLRRTNINVTLKLKADVTQLVE